MQISPITREVLGLPDTHVDELGGVTLASYWPLICMVHDAVGGGDVVEIGSDRGFVTKLLTERCAAKGATLHAVDPAPANEIARPGMTHHAMRSREFLAEAPPGVGLWIVDGDHNYETVAMELSGIANLTEGRRSAIILHDVSWPWARRDLWYNPSEAPDDGSVRRGGASVALDEDGSRVEGIPLGTITTFRERQGGVGNGVLTAVEDFLYRNAGWSFARSPLLFGFGLLVREDEYLGGDFEEVRRWMEAFETVSPVLASTEANRLRLLQGIHSHWVRADKAEARLAVHDRPLVRLALKAHQILDNLRGNSSRGKAARA